MNQITAQKSSHYLVFDKYLRKPQLDRLPLSLKPIMKIKYTEGKVDKQRGKFYKV
jgi:hypothetical protein